MSTTATKFHVIVATVITQLGNQMSGPVKNTDAGRRIVPIAGMNDVFVMIIFAAVGYVLKLMDFPAAPAILGMLLGETFERSIRQSLLISGNKLDIFFSSVIDWIFWIIIVVVIASVILSRRKKKAAEMEAA